MAQPTDLVPRRASAKESVRLLERSLRGFLGHLTVADAAARTGLALRDAETALFALAGEYRGHLKATSQGEVVFYFPRGLVKPIEEGGFARFGRAVGRALLGVGRLVIRAWVSVVVVAYAVVLGVVLLAMASRSDDGVGDAVGVVFQIVAEALFWTFHPFSPVYWEAEPAWVRGRRRRLGRTPKVPFYEKVNRFVFGPPRPRSDPRERERRLLGEIRRLEGRVGPGDVMRATGLPRDEAEALLCRMVVDYDGDIQVSDEGAVVYRFPKLRQTAQAEPSLPAAPPIWTRREIAAPLTGNSGGANLLFGLLNGFNLLASGYALSAGLTLERIGEILGRLSEEAGAAAPAAGGTAVLLGAIPFGFSLALFALPAVRALAHPSRTRAAGHENGRRAVLKAVLAQLDASGEPLSARQLSESWRVGAGRAPHPNQLTEAVRTLGGEPDVDETGQVVYRFPDLAREAKALRAERAQASALEQSIGAVVFSSTD